MKRLLIVSASAILLTACGGGASTSAPTLTAEAPSTPPSTPPPPPSTQAEPERYKDVVFDASQVQEKIQFGTVDGTPLLMDVYSPVEDTVTNRPVIVLGNGGFEAGKRNDADIIRMAENYATRGFVVASIDYRNISDDPTSQDQFDIQVIQAVHDMRAAVRFFREDARTDNIYGTTGDYIFAGGISSGAIAAAATGTLDAGDGLSDAAKTYLQDNGGQAGNSSNNVSDISSGVQGIVSVSGGISDFLWIDQYSAPIVAAHEELDRTVPCNFEMAASGVFMAGGCEMAERVAQFGKLNALYLVENSNSHVGYSDEDWQNILDGTAEFLSKLF